MSKIVEIMPDDLPNWARDAIVNGSLFRTCIQKVKTLEDRIERAKILLEQSADPFDTACMILRE